VSGKYHAGSAALALLILFGSAGCRAEVGDARRAHVLAGDHGWIDVTFNAPPKAAQYKADATCVVTYSLNGEVQFNDGVRLAGAASEAKPPGFRFAAPAGKGASELTISHCIPKPMTVALALDLPKDHLLRLSFDGTALVVADSAPYAPTTLEWVRAEVVKLRANNSTASTAIGTLTTVAYASLGLNLVVLVALILLLTRRKT